MADGSRPHEAQDLVLERIEDWRRRLIDLSYRNRLIRYRPTKASTIEIESPTLETLLEDPAGGGFWRFYFPPDIPEDEQLALEDAASFVDDIVVRQAQHEQRRPLADEIVVRGETSARRINRLLENLARKSNAEFQDKALRILYIAAGFLDWIDPTRNEALSSPLLLVPVELKRESASQPYRLHFVDDEEITVNPSLTEKLRRDLGRDIPEEWEWEAKPISVELDEIEAAVAEHGWSVRREAVIGLFSFQKFVMYRDLLDNEELVAQHAIVRSIAQRRLADDLPGQGVEIPHLTELDDVQPPDSDYCILDADATQRRCLQAARLGQSFVMQGPPGTGKSQTIANLIADSIGRGKRILFVSEKAAALDVVHNRLAAQGLDEFCLLLHGERAARREVVEELNRSLTGQLVPRAGMNSHEMERLTHLRAMLNSTAELVHLPMALLGDRSLRDVLGELAQLHAAPSAPGAPPPSELSGVDVRREFQQLDDIFQRLAERWRVSPKTFVWRDYAGARFSTSERARLLEVAEGAHAMTKRAEEQAADAARLLGWPVAINIRAVDHLIELGRHLMEMPRIAEHWLQAGASTEMSDASQEAKESFEELARRQAELNSAYPSRSSSDFGEELADDFEQRLDELESVAGRTDEWESDFPPKLSEARAFLSRASQLLSEIDETSAEVAHLLGQPDEPRTILRARQIAHLADLAFASEDRPEADWLVPAGLTRAHASVESLGVPLERFQSLRSELLKDYEPTALELDTTGLLRRFTDEYTSSLSKFRSSYRRDAKLIKSVRRSGKLPPDPREDLAKVSELQATQGEIEGLAERLSRALGSYFAGVDTDLAKIDRALSVAEEAISLAAPRSDLGLLSQKLGVESRPDPQLAQLVHRLTTALTDLATGIDLVSGIAAKRKELGDGVAINMQGERLRQLQEVFDRFGDVADELTRGAKGPIASIANLVTLSQLVASLQAAANQVADRQETWRTILDYLYRGAATDWPTVDRRAKWLATFERLVGDQVPTVLRAKLLEAQPRWPDFAGIAEVRESFSVAIQELASQFDGERPAEIVSNAEQQRFNELSEFHRDLSRAIDDVHDWVEFRDWRERASERGWMGFVQGLVQHAVPAGDVVSAFRRAFWQRRVEALFDEDPDLADRGTTYARWIEEFRHLDRRLVRSGADRLIAARNRLRPAHVAFPGSEVGLLRHEATKRRRHMPVRKLLAAMPMLMSDLKPCLMMSPLTVSHFLAPTHEFDLVIFDEASQVPPQDAINCIYRGKQLIVAGDSRQLPPTPFFQVAEAEETWTEETADMSEDMESILDSCEALLDGHPLRWHYRSRHEDLIAFSNRHVYDDGLLTFPSADALSPTKGVRLVYVEDGVYDRGRTGTNRREAQVVAQRVVAHLRDGRHSVGVISFNVAQATAISEELDRLRIENPDLEEHFSGDRLDSVFVKHLESVQGDERDVIVFSVGYGRNLEGKFTMNFGPLNKDGGYRRLNVAVTRARELVEVVSSVHAADFTFSENAGRGPRLLQEYIRYAELGASPSAGRAREDDFESPLEDAIAESIRELGLEPVPQVGAGSFRIALGIREPSQPETYILGIETDGESYRRTPTARDRDRLREEVLGNLKWRIHRVWSLDWVRNREHELTRLKEAIGGVSEVLDVVEEDGFGERERSERTVREFREVLDEGELSWVVEYECAELPKQHGYYQFHETINRETQRDLLVDLLDVEAPVHVDYAIRRLARAWGLARTSDRIRRAAQQAINMAVRKGAAELRGDFIWQPGQTLPAVREPNFNDDRTCRSIQEIPPEEIDLAFEKLAEMSGLSQDQLVGDVARVLGFDRVGQTIRDVLTARINGGAV